MTTMNVPPTEETPTSSPLPKRYWLWMGFNLLTLMIYLLPLSWPGEGVALLCGLSVFWAGVIAAFWQYRRLRLVPIMVALVSFYPVRTGTTRLLLLCGLLALWMVAVVVFRQRRGVLIGLMAAAGVIAGFVLLPGRMPNPEALRTEYVRSLQGFQGTAYIWGGENGVGIDCSGLVRSGWVDANMRTGLRTLNPGLVRQAARIWWQDCSAKEMGEGYRDRMRLTETAISLNRLDYRELETGDVVVTESGVHTLAYLGDRTWIEADPLAGDVITVQAPAAKNPWFEEPMKVLRWRDTEYRVTLSRAQ